MDKPVEDFPRDTSSVPELDHKEGCLQTALFVLFFIWLGAISLIALVGMWLFENLLFEGSLGLPDGRGWAGMGYLVLVALPLALLAWLPGIQRSFYRALFLPLLAGLLMLPARWLFLTDFQTAAMVVVGSLGMAIWVGFRILSRHPSTQSDFGTRSPSLFVILWPVVGIAWIPYALWGAFGSPLDLILGIAIGALLGWLIALSLDLFVSISHPAHSPGPSQSLFKKILFAVSAGLILSSCLPLVGYQFSLALPLNASAVGAAVIHSVMENVVSSIRRQSVTLFVGAAGVLPLIFVDGDELMLVITSTPGELIGYAVRMAFLHGLLLLAVGIVGVFFIRKLRDWTLPSRMGYSVTGLVWMVGLGLYVLAGQPGFYGERLFVIFRQQVNFEQQQLPRNPLERRKLVYQTLVENSVRTQSDVRNQLDRLKIEFRTYYLVNAMEVNGGPLLKLWLSNHPAVERVLPSPHLRPLSQPLPAVKGSIQQVQTDQDWNLKMFRAPEVWSNFGARGAGIVIGLSDSGAEWEHPQLYEQYRGKNGNHNYNWLDVWFGSPIPTDTSGHGTHTLGSILGKDVGVAPDAEWIGCVNLARNLGNPAVYLECWQFLFAPYPQGGSPFTDGRPELGAHIFNNSWGCPAVEGCDAGVFLTAVRALKAAGVFVVVSAGNSGYSGCGSVDAPPAIYEEVLTVGAVNRNGDLAGFSSLGPVMVDGSQRLKAEILAPGEEIFSSFPNRSYEMASGTSMAGPHLAGVVALMWSANPALIGDVDLTRQIIFDTARPYRGVLPECVDVFTRPAQGIGYGIVDAFEAVKRAKEVR
jgi:hypothetical protein